MSDKSTNSKPVSNNSDNNANEEQTMPPNRKKSDTEYLNLSTSAEMTERQPSPGTAKLTTAWRLLLRIGEQTTQIPIEDQIVIGRIIDDIDDIDFDLTPYGAYHFGVSRRHAVMSLIDGFLYLEDLSSTNGTRINGFQLTRGQKYRLRDGDEIEFARLRTNIRFEKPSSSS